VGRVPITRIALVNCCERLLRPAVNHVPPALERLSYDRVVIIDDHPTVRRGLTAALGGKNGLEVTGAFGSAELVDLRALLHERGLACTCDMHDQDAALTDGSFAPMIRSHSRNATSPVRMGKVKLPTFSW
jgi:hypothetical protein